MGTTEELLAFAVRIAVEAGRELVARQSTVTGVDTKTSATDPVSDADRASERLLVERVVAARPQDAVVGEEGADQAGLSGLRWVIDPLDGTVNYLYGFPGWSVSIACEDAASGPGAALLGVVHDPVREETFVASRDGGAFLRRAADGEGPGRPLKVRDPVPLAEALVATGFSYDPGHRAEQGRLLARLLPRIRDIRRPGSAALDLCWLAAGRLDGYYEDSTSHWDWAAGALVVAEAGGVVSLLEGRAGRTGVVAAARGLHDDLRAAVTGG